MNRKKLIKRVLIGLGIVFGVLVLALTVLYAISEFVGKSTINFQIKKDDIYYFSEDYSENISDDMVYMSFDRNIYFTDASGFSEKLTDDNTKSNYVKALFYNYFNTLMKGDATAHEKLFTEEYKRNFVLQEKFTPQKVYDINISFVTGNNGKDKYKVVYSIYENNGSYRADIGSNVAKVMVFEIDRAKSPLINSIGYITDKTGG